MGVWLSLQPSTSVDITMFCTALECDIITFLLLTFEFHHDPSQCIFLLYPHPALIPHEVRTNVLPYHSYNFFMALPSSGRCPAMPRIRKCALGQPGHLTGAPQSQCHFDVISGSIMKAVQTIEDRQRHGRLGVLDLCFSIATHRKGCKVFWMKEVIC